MIDPAQTPALNRGARDWHRDLYRGCKAAGHGKIVTRVHGTGESAGGFGAKFPDGAVVETSVGFGNLVSTHCAFVVRDAEYQKRVYRAWRA